MRRRAMAKNRARRLLGCLGRALLLLGRAPVGAELDEGAGLRGDGGRRGAVARWIDVERHAVDEAPEPHVGAARGFVVLVGGNAKFLVIVRLLREADRADLLADAGE